MAEYVGRRLLGEVEEGSLMEILSQLSYEARDRRHVPLGLDVVDELVDIFDAPTRTVSSHAQSSSPGWEQRDVRRPAATQLRSSPCIELASPSSGHGKSHLLYLIAAIAVLPRSINGISLGGQSSAVLYFDTDGHFSIPRFRAVVESYIECAVARSGSRDPSAPSTDRVISHALQHLHIFQPQSFSSLLTTLNALDTYLSDPSRHGSSYRRVHSLILDSATAFYWQDRHDTELANIPSTIEVSRLHRGARVPSAYVELRAALTKASKYWKCAVIYSVSDIQPRYAREAVKAMRSPLPRSWDTFPDVRLLLQKKPPQGFSMGMTAEQVAEHVKSRRRFVKETEIGVSANADGWQDWSAQVIEEVLRKGAGRFSLRVGESGVDIVR